MTAISPRDVAVAALVADRPYVGEFLTSLGFTDFPSRLTLGEWLAGLTDEDLGDTGLQQEQIIAHVQRLMAEVDLTRAAAGERLESLTILGGHDKQGRPEGGEVILRAGDVVCVVGPTGSGKSRLLGDIECLAQGDTPTGRHVLIDGKTPANDRRFTADRKLVAQLSQNMNFVVDLTVEEFVTMHARCRMVAEPDDMVTRVIACANGLTGEKFAADLSVTQLSGGQTRALMIADTALLSASPVVLIDEIENAGVDRKRALEMLMAEDKIVLISTHDPLLALRGGRRIVIRNGGIAEVIDTSEAERRVLRRLETVDATLTAIRDRLRDGQRLEGEIDW